MISMTTALLAGQTAARWRWLAGLGELGGGAVPAAFSSAAGSCYRPAASPELVVVRRRPDYRARVAPADSAAAAAPPSPRLPCSACCRLSFSAECPAPPAGRGLRGGAADIGPGAHGQHVAQKQRQPGRPNQDERNRALKLPKKQAPRRGVRMGLEGIGTSGLPDLLRLGLAQARFAGAQPGASTSAAGSAQ